MELTGLSLSDHTLHEVTGELSHELGVLEVSPTAAEMARRVAEMAAGKTWRPVMVLAIDGAYVPTRPSRPRPATGRGAPVLTGSGRGGKEARVSLLPVVRADRACFELAPSANGRGAAKRCGRSSRRIDPRGPGALVCARRWGAMDLEAGQRPVSHRRADPGLLSRP